MRPFSKGKLWWLAAVFGLGGSLMGIVAGYLASRVERARVSALCSEYVSGAAIRLAQETYAMTGELSNLRSVFDSSGGITREEFRLFTRDVLERHPEIQAIEWVPRIEASQREAHETRALAQGLAEYRIRTQALDGGLVVAPPQKEYYPVLYAEPLEPNRRALGFDLSSEKIRNTALIRAIETRALSLTEPVRLVQGGGHSRDLLALLPIYRRSEGPAAKSRPDGLVLFVIRSREILRQALPPRSFRASLPMQFDLIDEDAGGSRLWIDSIAGWEGERPLAGWTFEQSLEMGGRHWRLVGRPTKEFISQQLTSWPLLLGIGLFLAPGSVGALALSVVSRQKDAAFRRQARVYEAAFRSLSEGVVVADASGKLILFNSAAERILGRGKEDVDQSEWSARYDCFYADARTVFPAEKLPLARALKGETALEEVLILNPGVPEGAWISISGAPMRDERGAPEGGVVVFRDITVAKKASEELRSSLRQLADLKYAVDQAWIVAVTDLCGTILSVNDKFCEVSGYCRQELVGQTHRLVKSGYHSESFYRDLWGTITAGRVWKGTIRNRAKGGREYWVDTTIVPLPGEDGRPERFLALRYETTDRVRQEEQLLRLSNAVEQTADSVFITDRDGAIEYVNPAFEATTGYSRREALGQTPRLLKSGRHDPQYYEELWTTILAGKTHRSQTVNRKKNGELYHAEQTITPIKDADGKITHYVSVVKDVTDRVRRQAQEIEMRYASEIQQKLYPVCAPLIEGYDIAGAVFPMEEMCGDYFDYLRLPNDGLGLVIGDVCGHGLGPALIMTATRSYLRFLATRCAELEQIFEIINETLFADLERNRFVGMVLVRIDIASRRLRYLNAGSPPGYHLDRSGAVKSELSSTGLPFGISPCEKYPCMASVALDPGDLVVLLTDGVHEAEDSAGNFLGTEQALDVIRAHMQERAEQIVQHLYRATREFVGDAPQQDDITIVVCKVGQKA